MLPVVLLLLAAVSCARADYPLYIDELEDLVSPADRRLLEALDNNEYTPRSELQTQFNVILERQTQAVQSQYNALVQMEETERQMKNQYKLTRATQRGYADILRQLQDIEANLSLSESAADQQKWALKRQLPRNYDDSNEYRV